MEEELRKNEEKHKSQVLQIETTSMMTKYQLVFQKLEGILIRASHVVLRK